MSESSDRTWTIGQCVELACLLEATAPKAGNVHPAASFDDMTFTDFVVSAVAAAPVFEDAVTVGVGKTVLAAVGQRRRVVAANTNLGIVLLLAPLAAVPRNVPLKAGITKVLDQLTLSDATAVYEAIRLAGAGGLGKVAAQDIAEPPTETLLEVMRRAAERDLVARQYANGFADVLDHALPNLLQAVSAGMSIEHAIVHTHLATMARCPDTLIARRRGVGEAEEAARRAGSVLEAGWPDAAAHPLFRALDAWLREKGHERNPGSTADLVTAALFSGLRDEILRIPTDTSSGPRDTGPERRNSE